jgi:hypothetical protein
LHVKAHVTGAHQFLDCTITDRPSCKLEEGELSSTAMTGAMFDQTRDEKKAGFA